MKRCSTKSSIITVDELFIKLKNELIDGDNSLVEKYNNLKKLKRKSLCHLLKDFQNNYKGFFKIYKNGKGIKESDTYLNIGNFYIGTINTQLNLINMQENRIFAYSSISLGLLSVALATVTVVVPDVVNDVVKKFFPNKTPTKIDSLHLSIKETNNKIMSFMKEFDTSNTEKTKAEKPDTPEKPTTK